MAPPDKRRLSLHPSRHGPALADTTTKERVLTRLERRLSRQLASALFAGPEGPPPSERLDWLVDELDDFLAHAGTRAQLVYRGCLLTIGSLSPHFSPRRSSSAESPHQNRIEALERLEQSPLGLTILGAKALLCIVYYEHPEVAESVGVDGGCQRPAAAVENAHGV